MKDIFLSIVVPSYDEIVNLRKGVLDKIEHFLEKKKYTYDVIIVDDGSTDGSVEFVEKFIKENPNFKLIKNPHLGKAGAVTTGVLKAEGEYVLFTDMDQATPIEEVDKLLPYFEEGYDIVIGSRSGTRKGAPASRVIIAKSAMLLRSIVIGMNTIKDTQCGFKIFKKSTADDLFLKVKQIHKGFKKIGGSSVTAGFDMELLYLGLKHGYKIKEVPVEWLYVETRRVSPIRDSIRGVMDLVKIKINDLQGRYK